MSTFKKKQYNPKVKNMTTKKEVSCWDCRYYVTLCTTLIGTYNRSPYKLNRNVVCIITVSIRIFLSTIWKRKIDGGFSSFCHTRANYSRMMRRETLNHDDKAALSLFTGQTVVDQVSVSLLTRRVINLVSRRIHFPFQRDLP